MHQFFLQTLLYLLSLSIITDALSIPSENSYLNVQPELPHSSTEEPLCSRDVVRKGSRETQPEQTVIKTPHPGVASMQDHLQHWNNLSSEISLIPLSCTQTLLPPASLSTHTHTHTHAAPRMLDQTGSHLRLGFHPDLLWLCGKKSSVTLENH